MSYSRPFTALCGVILSLTTSLATAQPTGTPTPVEPPAPQRVDAEAWADAYLAYGEPSIVVLTGFPNQRLSDSIMSSTHESFAYQLRTAIEECLNVPEAELDLIDSQSLASAVERVSTAMSNADETEAIDLLANELQAELVIYVKFLDRDPRRMPNATANMTFEAISTSRGRKIVSFPFEWKIGNDVPAIKRYANALAVKFTNDFAARAGRSQRFDLRIIGMPTEPRTIRDFRILMGDLPDVDGRVRSPQFGTHDDPTTGEQVSMAVFSGFKYRGDNLDLAADVTDLGDEMGGLDLRFVSTEANSVTLRIVLPETTTSHATTLVDCQKMILRKDDIGTEQRRRLQELYDRKNAPRISVLVNRKTTEEEREGAEHGDATGLTGDTIVVVQVGDRTIEGDGEAEGDDDDPNQVRAIGWLENQTLQIENALFDHLGPNLLDFTRIDPNRAKAELQRSINRQGVVFGENELVDILRTKNIADVLVLGNGGLFQEASGEYTVTYTFRVVSLTDSVYLAGASVRGSLQGQGTEVARRVADEAIKQIACELIQSWLPPTKLTTTVKGARNATDMEAFLSTLAAQAGDAGSPRVRVVGSPSYDGGSDRGVFTMTLSYSCSWDELFAEFKELSEAIPAYNLGIEKMDTNGLVLNIVR